MSETNSGVTVTFKAGQGFEAPWIVVHAADEAEALSRINSGEWATLAAKTVEAAEFFRASHAGKQSFPGAKLEVQQAAPQAPAQGPWSQQGSQQSQPPAFVPQAPAQAPQQTDEGLIPPQHCSHGAMQLRRAKPESGKKWVAYMCPAPQGTAGQCSPVDAKTGKAWGQR